MDRRRQTLAAPVDWARHWAPYSDDTYEEALALLHPGQLILDIGAGDLRFARRAVARGCRVIAVEMQATVVERGRRGGPLPPGLTVVVADARQWAFPPALDAAVLLMRHCADYALYVAKLRAVGCPTLMTNARWRLGVEAIPLSAAGAYSESEIGWYACVSCGRTGFTAGDPSALTDAVEQRVRNVEGCPACLPAGVAK